MKWLGPILLIGVFIRHNTSQWLPGYTASEWFYVMGGLWEIVLCTAIILSHKSPLISVAMWIGILEGAQVSVCGALMGHRRTEINECDYLSGLPIGATMTGLYLLIICWAIGKNWRSASRS